MCSVGFTRRRQLNAPTKATLQSLSRLRLCDTLSRCNENSLHALPYPVDYPLTGLVDDGVPALPLSSTYKSAYSSPWLPLAGCSRRIGWEMLLVLWAHGN